MNHEKSCLLTGREILDRWFLDARSKLLDVAALLDRLDRASDGAGTNDFRVQALRDAAKELQRADFGRTRRIQNLLSDPTTAPIDELSMKGAIGAWPGEGNL